MGSIAALRASPRTPFYASSKAARRNLGASMALALHVARIETDRALPIPAGRAATVDEVVSPCRFLFLLSRQSSDCTGTTIYPTSGMRDGVIWRPA